MAFFESMLTLVLVAIVFLQVSRRLSIPYPTMLAMAGVAVAALPWTPDLLIDPQLALALFIAPALLDAAYDMPPRDLRRNWRPLLALAAMAVLLTTAAVAWMGMAFWGMPLAAAIALGAIVAPPDAAAASAMLGRFNLPRRTVSVLKGESLLNDGVALLIFSTSVGMASGAQSQAGFLAEIAFAAPGGVLLGLLFGKIYMTMKPYLSGTLGGTLFEFVTTFGVWVIAEHLHVSAVLTVVAYAMALARWSPDQQTPRDRILSYSVWEVTVFMLNVLAFLLMGLQARVILLQLPQSELWSSLGFAGGVFAMVVVVRFAWVLLYNRTTHWISSRHGLRPSPGISTGIVISWCGMRGLVTLATALALPASFPHRDTIQLTALVVVLGTLVIQGLTLGPLIRLLKFEPDDSFDRELKATRLTLIDAALSDIEERRDIAGHDLRKIYQADRSMIEQDQHPRAASDINDLKRQSIVEKRGRLSAMRRSGEIADDVYHALEQELDWAELAASPPDRFEIIEG